MPSSRFWRLNFLGPFFNSRGEAFLAGSISNRISNGLIVMQTGITDINSLRHELPDIVENSKNVTIKVYDKTTDGFDSILRTIDIDTEHFNNTSRISHGWNKLGKNAGFSCNRYNIAHTDQFYWETIGGYMIFEYDTTVTVNEVMYAGSYLNGTILQATERTNPSAIEIQYSTDNGLSWTTDHTYRRDEDLIGNVRGYHGHNGIADVMFLQRDLSTGQWNPGVIKQRMYGYSDTHLADLFDQDCRGYYSEIPPCETSCGLYEHNVMQQFIVQIPASGNGLPCSENLYHLCQATPACPVPCTGVYESVTCPSGCGYPGGFITRPFNVRVPAVGSGDCPADDSVPCPATPACSYTDDSNKNYLLIATILIIFHIILRMFT